ncbi:MAG: T9SS type A sorting domain-containing protein, partial [Gemmatimonadetes bacterium]|nr:T9SS type A sorting domain-containing protein [Gemmatimonadota bacterium]
DWSGGSFSQLRRICRVSKWGVPTAIETVEEQASANLAEEALSALRLYPNPFNAAVTIAFELEHSASVSVHIYNELGQQVRVLAAEGVRPAGNYQFVWDGRDQAGQFQASGTYLLVLAVDGAVETHKLTLLH